MCFRWLSRMCCKWPIKSYWSIGFRLKPRRIRPISRDQNWLAADLVIIIGAWNTNLVKKEDEPKAFEDFADPKWKGKLIAEPRDVELLIGLCTAQV